MKRQKEEKTKRRKAKKTKDEKQQSVVNCRWCWGCQYIIDHLCKLSKWESWRLQQIANINTNANTSAITVSSTLLPYSFFLGHMAGKPYSDDEGTNNVRFSPRDFWLPVLGMNPCMYKQSDSWSWICAQISKCKYGPQPRFTSGRNLNPGKKEHLSFSTKGELKGFVFGTCYYQ